MSTRGFDSLPPARPPSSRLSLIVHLFRRIAISISYTFISMAAPRSTSLRALRALSQLQSAPLRRSLHITGAQSAQPANPADKTTLYATRTLADLKAECQKRRIGSAGSKDELVDRLNNHDMLQSRAFSIAMRRIDGSAFSGTRQFNTSRASKAVHDSSTIDFAYMPSMADVDATPSPSGPRIPTFPDNYGHKIETQTDYVSPMKPQVHAVGELSSDSAVSVMSDVVDNHAVDIDPFSLTEAVGKSRGNAIRAQNGQSQETGILRDLWSGIVEDILGPKQTSQRK
ncbi:hypothetical protein DTO271G3_4139 [Paecilomyces variotii]|nr:hypothetical protein DTO271G3_4139 [Paecilomyces variotii]